MPFAPKIRKDILKVLEESILPTLKRSVIFQLLADSSYQFSSIEHIPIEQKYLAPHEPGPLQMTWTWKNEQMAASRSPYLMYVYEGIADYKVGVTADIAEKAKEKEGKVLSGAYLLRAPAPAFLYSVPGLPRSGTPLTSKLHGDYKTLCLFVMNQDVRIHLSGTNKSRPFVTHSLQIHSPPLTQMIALYKGELEAAEKEVAQAQLFVIMSHLYRQLKTNFVPLGNSAWPTHLNQSPALSPTPTTRDQGLCQAAMDHIETRLNSNLSRTSVAQALQISPDHLGRVFHTTTGSTLMNYITHRRIEAAKLILTAGPENIGEIASLVGFATTPSFSTAFKRITGITPSDYRRQHQKKPA